MFKQLVQSLYHTLYHDQCIVDVHGRVWFFFFFVPQCSTCTISCNIPFMLKKTRKLAHEHAAELWDTAKRTLLILRGIKILLTKNVNMQIV